MARALCLSIFRRLASTFDQVGGEGTRIVKGPRPRLAALTTNTETRCYSPQRDNYAVLYDREGEGVVYSRFSCRFLVSGKNFGVVCFV